MIDPTAYPKPVPLSQADALELFSELGQWPDVPATFLTFVMLGVEQRIGEWRFAGPARSLTGAFARAVEFFGAFEVPDPVTAVAELISSTALDILPRLEDGWSVIPYLEDVTTVRVVFFGEGGAPYDDHGFCILEVEPAEGDAFFSRAPETHRPPEWDEQTREEEEEE